MCSYLSLFETASEVCSSRSLSARGAAAGQKKPDGAVTYHAVTFGPVVPPECSEAFRNTIHELYKIYNPPLPENAVLMRGQHSENGGENARPPPQSMMHAAPPRVQVCATTLRWLKWVLYVVPSTCMHSADWPDTYGEFASLV